MKKPPITKEQFLMTIDKVRKAWDFDIEVHKLGCSRGVEVETDTSHLGGIATDLLSVMLENCSMDDAVDGDVEYFCWQLDFGRSWEPGSIIEEGPDGNETEIDFSSAEKLWDYLMKSYWEGSEE